MALKQARAFEITTSLTFKGKTESKTVRHECSYSQLMKFLKRNVAIQNHDFYKLEKTGLISIETGTDQSIKIQIEAA